MDSDLFVARVPRDIGPLIPAYLKNRTDEVRLLREFLAASNFGAIEERAQRMIGVGTPYGFVYITSQAKLIGEMARHEDARNLAELLKGLEDYLRVVKIVFR